MARKNTGPDWGILSHYFGTVPAAPVKATQAPRCPGKPASLTQAHRDALRADLGHLQAARALAEGLGVDIDRDTAGGWWVTCPDLPDDDMDDGHFCTTGQEVLEKVQEYQKVLAAH